MNNVQLFLLLALLLSVVVTLVLAWAARRAAKDAASGYQRQHVMSHVSVYREQLAELDRERAQGTLDQAGYDLSQQELSQRLMDRLATLYFAAHQVTPCSSSSAFKMWMSGRSVILKLLHLQGRQRLYV